MQAGEITTSSLKACNFKFSGHSMEGRLKWLKEQHMPGTSGKTSLMKSTDRGKFISSLLGILKHTRK